ncbi:hypothetical protein B296_00005859 [Ensete ventricosum]|uniref:Uncharacterized protein n=1 Tax=Ensete ventricosum TaxID=4639 RepID=A0A426ZV86_ENSVE|nr:hypothetical protein B296_00005859 [Ensete ventricosum]
MRLETRLEGIGSPSRVLGACQDGVREFIGRRPRLTGRLSRVVERRFVEGIRKLVRNTSGDHQKKTKRLIARIPEAAELVGNRSDRWVNRPYPDFSDTFDF